MHDRFAKDGFEVVAVNVDDPRDQKTRDNVVRFLTERLKARFVTLNLDPKSADWEKKLRTNGVPCVFVFNRANLYVKKLPLLDDKGEEKEEVDYDVIEQFVVDLMKK